MPFDQQWVWTSYTKRSRARLSLLLLPTNNDTISRTLTNIGVMILFGMWETGRNILIRVKKVLTNRAYEEK